MSQVWHLLESKEVYLLCHKRETSRICSIERRDDDRPRKGRSDIKLLPPHNKKSM